MIKEIFNLEELKNFIASNEASAVYFSTDHCNVCKVLKPKVIEFLETNYPKVSFTYVNIEQAREFSGEYSIFSVPTIVFYFDGRETFRKSRNFSLTELSQAIERPYNMMFT